MARHYKRPVSRILMVQNVRLFQQTLYSCSSEIGREEGQRIIHSSCIFPLVVIPETKVWSSAQLVHSSRAVLAPSTDQKRLMKCSLLTYDRGMPFWCLEFLRLLILKVPLEASKGLQSWSFPAEDADPVLYMFVLLYFASKR